MEKELGGSKEDWAKHFVERGLKVYEALVAETKGKYSIGDSITAADAFLIPQMFNGDRFKVDMT